MRVVRDQTGRDVKVVKPPKRIVSLVPSQTELLWDLGLEAELVGITKFCVHPEGLRQRVRNVGGTKNIRVDDVLALEPDLVVANKEENPRRAVEAIAAEVPTYVSDVDDLDSAADMIEALGVLTHREEHAQELRTAFDAATRRVASAVEGKEARRVIYLVWKDPYMAAGTDTFISAAMEKLNLHNVLTDLGEGGKRYPALEVNEIRELHPDLVFLSSEPYPFEPRHGDEMRPYLAEHTRLVCVDGEAFSWYGTRWMKSASYLERLASEVHETN